jgi:hypothetical protein
MPRNRGEHVREFEDENSVVFEIFTQQLGVLLFTEFGEAAPNIILSNAPSFHIDDHPDTSEPPPQADLPRTGKASNP